MSSDPNPQSRKGVEDHHFGTATGLLDALSPRHSLWEGRASEWIFRGQEDADYGLQPTAVRDKAAFVRHGIQIPTRPEHEHPQAWSQRRELLDALLRDFRDLLDRSGHVIPGPSPRVLPHEYDNQVSSSAEPEPEAYPLMALAQHHGLPTLLLDWTRRAWVAAYFATRKAADHDAHGKATHLAVWALPTEALAEDTFGPRLYQAPAGTNPNLRAQAGLFTVHAESSLEEFFAAHPRRATLPPLRRMMLPLTEAGRLLRLLAEEGIDGASMFPGADGAVRAMRERALWAR